MNIYSITHKANELQDLLALTESRRDEWNTSTKSLIKDTLDFVKSQTKLNWFVQNAPTIKNLENVNIQFHSKPSGIVSRDLLGERIIHYTKEGGKLYFAQSANGEIFTAISYPYIAHEDDYLIERKIFDVIAKLEPHSVSKEFVVSQVENFLDEMLKWEANINNYQKIGF